VTAAHLLFWTHSARWDLGQRAVLAPRALGIPAATGMLVAILATRVASAGGTEESAHALVIDHREAITTAACQSGIDPRTVAAIVFVTQRDHTNPFKEALEKTAANAWLTDSGSQFKLSPGLDVSLGLVQIKPLTALTGHVLTEGPNSKWAKEYRDVPRLDWSLPYARVRSPWYGGASKQTVVEALLAPETNLRICAFLLSVYAAQWEAADERWSIRHRPEILATLYQIGFERSQPKPDPRANAFGAAVAEAHALPWINEAFAQVCPSE